MAKEKTESKKAKTKVVKEEKNAGKKAEPKDVPTGEKEETGKKPTKLKKSKTKRRSVVEGNVYIKATYNNTLITVTELNGEVMVWSSAGSSGFKGTRKATPYAAQVAAETAAGKAKTFGMERAHIFVQGVGSGREQAIRGIHAGGLNIESLTDVTPIPHNGCRKKKGRRV